MKDPRGNRRAKIWLVVGLLLLGALLLWWLRGRKADQRRSRTTTVSDQRRAPGAEPDVERDQARADRTRAEATVKAQSEGTPIIDKVTIEKTEVCEGEENLVTVKAHTPGHFADAYLHYTVAGRAGQQVPVRSWQRDKEVKNAEKRYVYVFGRNNVPVKVELPFFRVKKCKVPRRLYIQHRLLPNAPDTLEFSVQILEGHKGRSKGAKPADVFVPVRYEWDFGDGAKLTTRKPLVVHDYHKRMQDSMYSQFLIRCRVTDKAGRTLVGRAPLQLRNVAFAELRQRGRVLLLARMTPRFPKIGKDGVVDQSVLVYHHHPRDVTLTQIRRTIRYRGQRGIQRDLMKPRDLLGTNRVPAEGVENNVILDTRKDSDILLVRYELIGKADDGYPASGFFTIMRPGALPTRDKHVPVTDTALKERILRARRVLGQEYVSEEDLIRLERTGRFRDLPRWRRGGAPPRGYIEVPVSKNKP